MARELNCVTCSKNLGIVRDGSISKGLHALCSGCFNKMNKSTKTHTNKKTATPDFGDIFGDIFPDGKIFE